LICALPTPYEQGRGRGDVVTLIIMCALALAAQAQANVTGEVIEARTGAPLAAVLVQVESTRQRAYTDADGRFMLTDVPAGSQTLLVSVVGFGLVRRQLVVDPLAGASITIAVAEGASTYVEEVAVSADRFREAQPGAASQAVLGSRELLALRGVIADDPFRAVQVLPGVAATDDFRAEFAVRGLGPAHVGLAIDGVDSRLLFHTVRGISDTGSLALINSDVLEEASLLSGAYAQTLGSQLGARLDVRTRDGARDRLHVRAVVSGSATTTVWEGPVGHGPAGSWLVAARKSYIDWILRRVDPTVDATLGFIDAQGKLTLTPTDRQTLRISLIGGRSALQDNDEDEDSFNAFNRGLSQTVIGNAHWRFTPSPAWTLTQQLYVVQARYQNRVTDGRSRDEGRDRDLTWRTGVQWAPSLPHLFEAGAQAQWLDVTRVNRRFTSATRSMTVIDANPDAASQAAWLSYRWSPAPSFLVAPGIRVERWSLTNETAVSPWMLMQWDAAPATRLRAGVSVQRQAPALDDVLWLRPGDTFAAERAVMVDAGIERRLTESWRVTASLYYRDESDRLGLLGDQFRRVNGLVLRPTGRYIVNALEGSARGGELTLERRSPNGLSGWASYAYGDARTANTLTGEDYPGDFDQRHTINASLGYRWTARAMSARYRYGSNFPFTGYIVPAGDIHMLTSVRNSARLPPYSRLDVRADQTFLFRQWRLTLFGEVVNVLNRRNLRAQSGGIDVVSGAVYRATERLFPILPSAGILVEF
jgi:hypothetical protein